MGIVQGNAGTFGNNSFVLNGGRVTFIPSSPAAVGSRYALSDLPVQVILGPTGDFEVNLVATDQTRPGTFYRVMIENPDAANNFTHLAVLPFELRVPSGPGPFQIADLITASANPAMVWVGATYPSDSPPSLGTGWLVTDPDSPDYGWLMEWR